MFRSLTIVFIFIFCQEPVLGQKGKSKPNIIVIFCDDLGYGDLSSYGSVWNETPEIDKMVSEGVRFTNFYAGAPVCTPSRAGLLTGCYARRVDLDLNATNFWVLNPVAKKGINPQEKILPEVLKKSGYATAIIGKWHLGDQPEFLPTRHGFDYWFGIPYSNNMEGKNVPPLPLMRNEDVFEQKERKKAFDQSTLTQRYTNEAIKWIDENRKSPFFLYLAHTMPHNPVAARPEFFEKTNNPIEAFGACVAELSWSTGEILNHLKRRKLDKNTLVIFTSDNGGALRRGAHNGILKGAKGKVDEGGIRVPFVARWPGKIPAGSTCHAPASVIDFYETFAALSNTQVDKNAKRDGTDISDYLFNPNMKRKERPYFYWHVGYLRAIRYGNWKIHLTGAFSKEGDTMALFNLQKDPGETTNRAEENPEIVAKLMAMAEQERRALGEFNDYGPEVRRTILVENPKPLVKRK